MLSLRTPLFWAFLLGSATVSALATVPTDPDAIIDATTGNTTLIKAAGTGDTATVLEALVAGATPDLVNKAKWSALAAAAKQGDDTTLTTILYSDPDVELLSGDKNTPLFEAIKANCSACVTTLLAANANTTTPGWNGTTAFSPAGLAAAEGYLEILQLLVPNSSAPALNSTVGGMQPIHWAANKGQNSTLGYLLETGANANTLVQAGNADRGATPLLLAIAKNSTVCAQTLLDSGALIEGGTVNGTKTTPMKLSIDQGLLAIISTLITANATLLTAPVDTGSYPPLGYAATKGLTAVATDLLTTHSAPLGQIVHNDTSNLYYNLTAGHIAAYLGDTSLLTALLTGVSAADTMALATGPASCYDIALAAIAGDKKPTLDWLLETHYKGGIENPNNYGSQNWTLSTDNANNTASGTTCGIKNLLAYAKARNAENTKLAGDKPKLVTKNKALLTKQYLQAKLVEARAAGY